jgi:uncharacterized protein YcgI (DUF1989 family)
MDDIGIVPASHGKAIELKEGERIRIINTHGTQVLDTWAFNAADPHEWLSMEHTRSVTSRLVPRVGDCLVSTRRRPMLRFLADTSPGRHDTLLCACNHALYVGLGCTSYHRSCEDNLHEALGELSIRIAATPAPFNLFMNVPVTGEGGILREPPVSRPGDAVEFRAEIPLILVLSACPQDITVINGQAPRDAHYHIFDAVAAA